MLFQSSPATTRSARVASIDALTLGSFEYALTLLGLCHGRGRHHTVFTLAQLFGVADTELSALARVGSGSACRSMYGGWVKWEQGVRADGTDSIAVQTHDEAHWNDMQILILVVCWRSPLHSSLGLKSKK